MNIVTALSKFSLAPPELKKAHIKAVLSIVAEYIKGIGYSWFSFRLMGKDAFYRQLNDEERFWSRIFYRGNVKEFEDWVKVTPESRQEVSNLIRDIDIKSILDVGCGTVQDYEQYLSDNLKVEYHGIDLTRPFVEVAKSRYPYLDILLGSANQIPCPDKTFDAVSCRHLLEHLGEVELAISEMTRVSGQYVIITWFMPPARNENIRVVKWRGGKSVHFNHYSKKYIEGILEKNSLVMLRKTAVRTDEVWLLEKVNTSGRQSRKAGLITETIS